MPASLFFGAPAAAVISLLGSDVGRGHAFYLDGVERELRRIAPQRVSERASVFEISRGLGGLGWKSIRAAYYAAGLGSPAPALYAWLRSRSNYDSDSPILRILGHHLRLWADAFEIVVVDHPTVVGALGDRAGVWYLHGEPTAPPETLVTRPARILVPTEGVARAFLQAGVDSARVSVTGLCVDLDLLPNKRAHTQQRRTRIASYAPLSVAFFSSGAEPRTHVASLTAGAAALARSRHRALVFAARGGRLERAVRRLQAPSPELVSYSSRQELDALTAEHFPSLDLIVSPPHERTSWSLALGIPCLLVGPDIGPFAPRNRALLLEAGVAAELDSRRDARALPERIDELRASEALLEMSERGSVTEFRGFERSAELLIEESDAHR
ncbi:MAG: hypothetical protein HRU00_11145 [Myxococcales bacterium]|nr:hypothetical protein [Myxococcales bacterium]